MTPERRPEPRLSLRDLLSEAGAGLMARPARVALTVLGTVIGVAALVATLGLSKTAGSQIVGRFSTVAATDVVITPVPGALGGSRAATVIPWDAEARLRRLNGVAAAGTLSEVDVRGALVRSVPINDPLGQTEMQLPVRAASRGAVARRAGAADAPGGFPDAGHSARGNRTVVLGEERRSPARHHEASTSSRRSSSATGSTRSSASSGASSASRRCSARSRSPTAPRAGSSAWPRPHPSRSRPTSGPSRSWFGRRRGPSAPTPRSCSGWRPRPTRRRCAPAWRAT